MTARAAPIVGVGVLALRGDGALLIGRRISGPGPLWCLPGGHLEAGEDFERAARRELEEEAGITAAGPARLFALALDTVSGAVRVTGGVLLPVGEEAARAFVREPEVFDAWAWSPPREPPAPLFPASAALLDAWNGRPPGPGWTVYRVPTGFPEQDGTPG